jgi:hypothetical protein
MKYIFNFFFALSFILIIFSSCRTGRKMTSIPDQGGNLSVHGAIDSPEAGETLNIPVRTESFSFELPQDRAVHDPNQYFVILGSFRFNSNANSFKTKLTTQGFEPVILISERGYHRISVASYRDEAQARAHVIQVRQSFPEYHDAWLLVRK